MTTMQDLKYMFGDLIPMVNELREMAGVPKIETKIKIEEELNNSKTTMKQPPRKQVINKEALEFLCAFNYAKDYGICKQEDIPKAIRMYESVIRSKCIVLN